jgi:D-alanyl-D-alanine carboxypeptidase
MRTFCWIVAFVLLGLGIAGAQPRPQPAATTTFGAATTKAIDLAITNWFARYKAPGVIVGIWFPQKGSYVSAQGVGNPSTGIGMHLDDHMRIGSVTKTFTITLLLQLADRKRISLDDPVSKYVPNVPNGSKITLRMLANMTSGIFNYTEDAIWEEQAAANPYRTWTTRELVNVGLSHPPYFAPGAGWHYSNTNTLLAGMVIERVLGQSIATAYQRYIFTPLGLHHTIWPLSGALPFPYAHGVTPTANGKIVDATKWNPSIASTAGAIVSTLADMRIWAKAVATGDKLISPAMQKQRLTWVKLPPLTAGFTYGLGIANNHGWLGHNGSIPGFSSYVVYLPSQDATIVILASSDVPLDKKMPADALLDALTRILTPQNVTV